jgi:eukaryotic-like serine/threonine-protein kinase
VRGKRSTVPLPKPGETLAGKYKIVRVVGEGGMGVVFEATHEKLRNRVAVKALMPSLLEMADVVARFEREGRTAAQLRGRHVARVLDVDTTRNGLPFMVMEYLEGQDLDSELQRRKKLPIGEAVDYVLQACEAMAEAHAVGVVHRDLKPANLFLCSEREARVVKVLDFGISKSAGDKDARLTGTYATVGTPLYMSPEQVRSPRSVDHRTDIWSLGVILFELLTGSTPFLGSTTGAAASIVLDPPLLMKDLGVVVPPELEAAVLKALEKDASRRFPDVRSFAAAIAPFAAHPSLGVFEPPASASAPSLIESPANVSVVDPEERRDASAMARAETVYSEGIAPSMGAASVDDTKPAPTAPGWTTHSASKGRSSRWLALGPLALLALGGGGALLWSSSRPSAGDKGTSAATTAPAPEIPTSSSPAPSVTAPSTAMPGLPSAEPVTAESAAASATARPPSQRSSHPSPSPAPIPPVRHPRAPTAPATTAPSPPPATTGNPFILK